MNTYKTYESYKAKCKEKNLPLNYKNAEEFSKAMNEPPKPFSTDDFMSYKKEETLKKGEPNAGTFKEIVPTKRGVGRPPKMKSHVEILSDEPLHVKDASLLKEPAENIVSMKEEVLHEIIIMAYERGVMQAEALHASSIEEADIPMIVDDVLGGRHVQNV